MFGKKKERPVPREDGLTDYDVYIMGKQERILTIIFAAIVLFAVGYVFYHNIILSMLFALLSFKSPDIRTEQIIRKRKNQLTLQFKDMLYSLSSALSVGKSVETGLKDSLTDLRVIYPDPQTDILVELEYIIRGISMNNTVESMLQKFAERAHLEDVDNFVDIFVTCKRTGGDLIQVMRSTSNTIGEKIEVKQEIDNCHRHCQITCYLIEYRSHIIPRCQRQKYNHHNRHNHQHIKFKFFSGDHRIYFLLILWVQRL